MESKTDIAASSRTVLMLSGNPSRSSHPRSFQVDYRISESVFILVNVGSMEYEYLGSNGRGRKQGAGSAYLRCPVIGWIPDLEPSLPDGGFEGNGTIPTRGTQPPLCTSCMCAPTCVKTRPPKRNPPMNWTVLSIATVPVSLSFLTHIDLQWRLPRWRLSRLAQQVWGPR